MTSLRRALAVAILPLIAAGCAPAGARPAATIAPDHPSPAARPSGLPGPVPTPTPFGTPAPTAAPIPDTPSSPALPLLLCSAATSAPAGTPLPSGFKPGFPCQLEQSKVRVECLADPAGTPPSTCSREDWVSETAVAEDAASVLFLRDYRAWAGCWDAVSWQDLSLRLCRKASGAVTTLAEDVVSAVIPSPDGQWLAFAAAEPGSYRLKPHLYRIRSDGSGMQRLDPASSGYNVVGITIKGWSVDGQWVEVSLWDGSEGGYHALRVRADGSGATQPG